MRYVSDFISAVEARQTKIADSLVNGEAMTFDSYQRLVGVHAGLEEALTILNDLLKEEDEHE
jgi:hypothetical protein